MKISGVKIPAGVTITAPAQESQAAPSGPSKFVVGAPNDDDAGDNSGSVYVYNIDGTGEVKITASDHTANDYFGYSVAVQGDKIIAGAMLKEGVGAAYIYNLDGTGEQKLTASDGAGGDNFGSSVAMSDTKIVVAAPYDDDAGTNSGSAYVYNLDGTGEVKLTASDGAGGDYFGQSVAMSNTKVVVCAYGDDDAGSTSGSVYVYNLDGSGEVKVTASDGAAGDYFGYSVAVSDTKIVVGGIGDNENQGSVYVYNTDGTGELKITASDAADGDAFGFSVAMSDTKIVVGAQTDDDNGNNSGSVYVYNTDGTGEVKITASDGAANDRFGWTVDIQGDKIIAGAMLKEGGGAAYIYNLDGTGEQKIQASDGASGDQFGRSVAAS